MTAVFLKTTNNKKRALHNNSFLVLLHRSIFSLLFAVMKCKFSSSVLALTVSRGDGEEGKGEMKGKRRA
jgi:hypothetical protein